MQDDLFLGIYKKKKKKKGKIRRNRRKVVGPDIGS